MVEPKTYSKEIIRKVIFQNARTVNLHFLNHRLCAQRKLDESRLQFASCAITFAESNRPHHKMKNQLRSCIFGLALFTVTALNASAAVTNSPATDPLARPANDPGAPLNLESYSPALCPEMV
jgi:hypothetical protein